MWPALLLLLGSAAAQSCTFPYNFSGWESMGNTQAAGVSTAAQCAQACCAKPGCTLWQFCPPATLCESTQGPSCWVGDVAEPTHRSAGWVGGATAPPPAPNYTIVLRPLPAPAPIPGIAPATNPATGQTLTLDSLSLRLNGAPILPICGEMHPGRVPAASWRSDLLRMKAGGLTVVSSYVFWLHVEEIRGQPDWGGSNNLTLFLDTARDVGLLVALRIGPWDHGEARNGGLPDWVVDACRSGGFGCRTTAPGFLALARGYYAQLAAQMAGRGFSEGGPVISIQVDNECVAPPRRRVRGFAGRRSHTQPTAPLPPPLPMQDPGRALRGGPEGAGHGAGHAARLLGQDGLARALLPRALWIPCAPFWRLL